MENYAVLVGSAILSGAVKIAGGIDHERADSRHPAVGIIEVVYRGLSPNPAANWHRLEHGTVPFEGSAIEVSGSIEREVGVGKLLAALWAPKTIKYRLAPCPARLR